MKPKTSKTIYRPHYPSGKLVPDAETNPFHADTAREKIRKRGSYLDEQIKKQTGG